jgi:hypothetical protein
MWISNATGFGFNRFLAVSLFLGLAAPARAQDAPPISTPAALKVVILEGEGAINLIKMRVTRTPMVQVVDENNKPVAGAMVMFTVPDTGAGGTFADGSKTHIAYTNSAGKVSAVGLKANAIVGNFKINVNASFKGLTASASLGQTNIVAAAAAGAGGGAAGKAAGAAVGGVSKTLIAVIAVVGGAAAAGAAVAASGGGGNGSSPPPVVPPTTYSITINAPGTPTFTQPKR